MPRIFNKLKSSGKTKIIIFVAVGAVVLSTGGLVFASKNDQDLKVNLGGKSFGVWFGPNGEPHVEFGQFGCCSPYCEDMFEIECSREYGYDGTFYPGARCDYDVPECREGCCLPDCQEVPKVQCEGDYGFGDGGWQPLQCRDVPECEVGCCNIDGIKRQEMKAPCEDASGIWTKGECKMGYSVDMESTSTKTISNVTVTQTMYYHLYTCSDTVYGVWTGNAEMETQGSGGGYSTDVSKEDINLYFNFDAENGTFDSSITGSFPISVNGRVTESNMTFNLSSPGLVEHHAEGKVQEGAEECLTE